MRTFHFLYQYNIFISSFCSGSSTRCYFWFWSLANNWFGIPFFDLGFDNSPYTWEKETHIRDTHTFECNMFKFRNKTKEKLNIDLLTCEIYVCSLSSYKHKRLSELKRHIKTRHTTNAIIRRMKMDREDFSKLSCQTQLQWK